MNMTSSFDWDEIHSFLAVCENHSFSAAAIVLRVGQPTISRRIKNLEQRLGEQLFIRGKFGAEPTSAGRNLIPAAEQMAKWAGEFANATKAREDSVSGSVTIAAPPGIAASQLAPFAKLLSDQYPKLSLQVLASIGHLDLARGEADIAIRTKAPLEPELVSLYSSITPQFIICSKDYAATIDPVCKWSDINWITWGGQFAYLEPRPTLEQHIENFQPVFSSDDYMTNLAALQAGLGASIMSKPLNFEQTDLVKIESEFALPSLEFHIVCARSMQHVPRLKAVSNSLIAEIKSLQQQI